MSWSLWDSVSIEVIGGRRQKFGPTQSVRRTSIPDPSQVPSSLQSSHDTLQNNPTIRLLRCYVLKIHI